MANVLSHEKRLRVLAALLDGNSIRAVSRMTGVHQDTISRFALVAGQGAQSLHNSLARGLSCTLLEVDELWTFCGIKTRNKTEAHSADLGDVWVWVGIDAVSKMVISWHAGNRDQKSADAFMLDLCGRLTVMPQITSDGFAAYEPAIYRVFGPGVDHAQVVKSWQKSPNRTPDHRYAPPTDAPKISKRAVLGTPNLSASTTAHVERNNLTIRHMNGRLRRLCLAFSKRPENHAAALALSYVAFNMMRVQKGMKITPAMAAGVVDHIWDLEEFLTAIMTAEPCAPPDADQLRPRVPETTHREIPGGRGFLRVVDGGKSNLAEITPISPHPVPVMASSVPVNAASAAPSGEAWEQMDLLSYRPRSPQLSLWGDE